MHSACTNFDHVCTDLAINEIAQPFRNFFGWPSSAVLSSCNDTLQSCLAPVFAVLHGYQVTNCRASSDCFETYFQILMSKLSGLQDISFCCCCPKGAFGDQMGRIPLKRLVE